MKAQGSAEYLVLLGAALVVALAVVGMLAYYAGTTDDAKKAQSDIYWRKAYPVAVLEATGHGERHMLLLKNIGNERLIIRGINVSGSTAFGLDYANALSPYRGHSGQLKRIGDGDACGVPEDGKCNTATHSQLNCSINLPPGKEIWVEYFLYGGLGGSWTGEPTDACGMRDQGAGQEIYLNSLRRFAGVKGIKIYYSTSTGSAVKQIESGAVDLHVACGDYGFRQAYQSNGCADEYECGRPGSTNDGMCIDYVY